MQWKKVAPIAIALVLGLFAAKMAFNMVQQKQQEASAPAAKRPQVMMAKHAIDAGSVIGPDDLVAGEIGSDLVPETTFTSVGDLEGRVAMVPLIEGQVITSTLLAPKGMGPGLQAVVPVGMRAVTLEINEITGVAGNLSPGCHVDVLQTLRDDQTGDSVAKTIAQNVKVTALGSRKTGPDPVDPNGAHSVTLLVTPQQAELLELAASTGRPRLTLRSGNDLAMVATPGVSLTELRGHQSANRDEFNHVSPVIFPSTTPSAEATTRPDAVADDEWTIQIIRGGSETDTRFTLRQNDANFTGYQNEAK